MKNFIISCTTTILLITNSAHADLDPQSLIKDMKELTISMGHKAKNAVIGMKDIAVEASQRTQEAITSVSKSAKVSTMKASEAIKTTHVSISKKSKEAVITTSAHAKNLLGNPDEEEEKETAKKDGEISVPTSKTTSDALNVSTKNTNNPANTVFTQMAVPAQEISKSADNSTATEAK